MKILVTGASGFLGRELVQQLITNGYQPITTDKTGAVDLIGNLSDEVFCNSLPNVDVVVHCAAVQYVSKDIPIISRTNYFHTNNYLATKNLCERYNNTNIHFINIGTSMMYDQCNASQYNIRSKLRGQGVYSESKLECQNIVDNLSVRLKSTVIPCIIGGEGREGLFLSFVKMMMAYKVVFIPGKGSYQISMVHVHDVASLVLKVIEKQAEGHFNAAASDPITIQEWIKEIADELNINSVTIINLPLLPIYFISKLSRYRVLAREQLLMLSMPHVLNTTESREIGWHPIYKNSDIVRHIARHIKKSSK